MSTAKADGIENGLTRIARINANEDNGVEPQSQLAGISEISVKISERPLLFSAPMVRAILRNAECGGSATCETRSAEFGGMEALTPGTSDLAPKTQTRRVLKGPGGWLQHHACLTGDCDHSKQSDCDAAILIECPYGKPGDRIWVKETHIPKTSGVIYRADFDEVEASGLGGMYGGWKPSIFMRREYSRINLEIVSVRVERLQEISEADAIAEGIEPVVQMGTHRTWTNYAPGLPAHTDAISSYRSLWNSLNLKPTALMETVNGKKVIVGYECFPWNNFDFDAAYPGVCAAGMYRGKPITVTENPYVWVIGFKKI